MTRITVRAKLGVSCTINVKRFSSTGTSLQSDLAIAVALRGSCEISDISPKKSPGVSLALLNDVHCRRFVACPEDDVSGGKSHCPAFPVKNVNLGICHALIPVDDGGVYRVRDLRLRRM
jgi:hypothetical protein